MTFVGKILVIVIMVFALFFLAVSTVVYSTAVNWKDEATKRKTEISKLNTEVSKYKTEVEAQKNALGETKKQADQQIALLSKEVKDAQEQTNLRQKEITDQRTEVEKAQDSANRSLAEAEARLKETGVIREELAKVQDQANEYKLRQTQLNDEIRVLKRELETATTNNKSLRDYLNLARAKIISLGFSDDIATLRNSGQAPPPAVEGEVDKVSSNGDKVEITIGSDDGLVKGHVLNVFRVGANSTYIGQIKIISVDPDRAVGEKVNKWYKGQKPQEHDVVASQIRSRG